MVDFLSRLPLLSKFSELEFPGGDFERGECLCPAHDDGTKKDKKSLHVKLKEDRDGKLKALLYCHAGCSTDQILSAVGAKASDLFESAPGNGSSGRSIRPKGKIVRVYDYVDPQGKIHHQTVRFDPKEFKQWARSFDGQEIKVGKKTLKAWKDGRGNWKISTLAGIEPIPYRLPELIAANPAAPIFFCEGEKDADRVASLRLPATTVPMGSGKWRDSYAEYFRGKIVVIIPDEDKPRRGLTDPDENAGLDGAKKVAKALIGIARKVAILRLPDLGGKLTRKYDVSDFIDTFKSPTDARTAILGLLKEVQTIDSPEDLESATAGKTSEDFPAVQSPGRSENAGTPAAGLPQTRGEITNCIIDAEGNPHPKTIPEIMADMKRNCDNWPKRIGNKLFFCDREANPDAESFPIHYLPKSSNLFGWVGSFTNHPVTFARGASMPSKDEVHAECQRLCPEYEAIEHYPHYPPRKSIYYACREPEKWVSKRPGCLFELVNFFEPEEKVDRDLMLAMILTLFWGGDGGHRPLFVITSQSGQGAGKTTFAELIASLVGGTLSLSANSDAETLTQRLLSPEGTRSRVVLMDNIKRRRFSWAEMESIITAGSISGKEMYVGESRRPNLLTYIVTINGPSFSTDLAQRSVTIKLGKPIHDGDWFGKVKKFIQDHRDSLIAEALQMLMGPKSVMKVHTRWGSWENNVLGVLDPHQIQECQKAIRERQSEIDVEQEEAQIIIEHFERQLDKNNLPPETSKVLLTSEILCDWLNSALGDRHTKIQACRFIDQLVNQGRLPQLTKTKYPERLDGGTAKARGYWWEGRRWSDRKGAEIRPRTLETHLFDNELEWQD